MKLLHIINSLDFGGAEKLLVDSLPIYKTEGIDVSLLILNDNNSVFKDKLTKQGINIISINKSKSVYNPLLIIKIIPYLKKNDIIHVHLFPALYWVSIANFFLFNKGKLILTEHNTQNRRRKILIFKYIDKLIYKSFSQIIAISNGTKENLKRHLGNSFRNIITINNGINLNLIENSEKYPKQDLNINDKDKIIIQISSFTLQKDQKTLIRTIKSLPKNIHLLLVGDGPLKESTLRFSEELGLNNRVHFLGYRSDVPKLIKTADICVLSSHYEGFGLSIVEGMAAKKPCIGTNVPGLSEVLNDENLLFNVGDSDRLKLIINQIFEDKNYYKKVAEECFLQSKKYSIELMVSEYTSIYKKIASTQK